MSAPFNSWQNYLLAALPSEEFEHISPHLELVQMPLGKILYESGDGLHYVYFPTTCIVSKLYVTKNGASAEIAVVGNDGIIGISIFMGGGTIPNRAVAPGVTLFIAALYPGADYPDGTASSL